MTEEVETSRHEPAMPAPRSGRAAIAGTSLAWIIGAGLLINATYPGTSTTANLVGHSITAPDSSEPQIKPASAQTVVAAQSTTSVASTPTFDFLVKFEKDHPDLETCVKTFHTDKEAAKKIFAEWAADREVFSDISLRKVSYSGEMILTWNSGMDRPLVRDDVESKLKLIKSAPGVRYADKDSQISVQKGL